GPLRSVRDHSGSHESDDELDDEAELDEGGSDDQGVVDQPFADEVVGGEDAEHSAEDEERHGEGGEHARNPTWSPSSGRMPLGWLLATGRHSAWPGDVAAPVHRR